MRLIDAEEFKDDIFRQIELIKVNDFEVLPVVDVNECLDNAPTVKAIPIEWFENWKRGKTSIEQVVADKIMMDYKHRDWEKENARD